MNKRLTEIRKIKCKRILFTFAFVTLVCNSAFSQKTPELDSLGNVWIITTDKSGSMLYSGSATRIADDVCRRLSSNGCLLNKIDYTKDRFLFFCSGYMPDYYIGEGNSIVNAYVCNRKQPSLEILNQIAEIITGKCKGFNCRQ
jgi:hypothetical protein